MREELKRRGMESCGVAELSCREQGVKVVSGQRVDGIVVEEEHKICEIRQACETQETDRIRTRTE